MKNKKENNINIKTIWKLLRSEKGRRYSFIIFYVFFFIFLFIFINSGNNTTKPDTNNNSIEESSLPFLTKNLENNNYKFKYIIYSNLDELEYLGEVTNNIINITYEDNIYEFNYQNGNLISLENNNILHPELFDIYSIKRIIKSSKLVSETKINDTNENIYNYTITNKDLSNINLTSINNLINTNEISVKTNKDKEIESIEYNLLNYEKELNNDLKIFKIVLEIGDEIE